MSLSPKHEPKPHNLESKHLTLSLNLKYTMNDQPNHSRLKSTQEKERANGLFSDIENLGELRKMYNIATNQGSKTSPKNQNTDIGNNPTKSTPTIMVNDLVQPIALRNEHMGNH